MGLRCSLLGHDYGEAFVERDREERGDEVVVTERELKECARCGSETVTTENTEVRALQAGQDDRADAAFSEPAADAAGEPASASASTDAGGSPAGGAFTSATDAIEHAEPEPEPEPTVDEPVGGDPDADDAVILDDDAADEPGSDQWDEPSEPEPDPEPEPVDDDAEVVDAGPADEPAAAQPANAAESTPAGVDDQAAAEAADPDRDRGEWPDADADDEGFDATASVDDDAAETFEFGDDGAVVEDDTGFTSVGPLDNAERSEADELDFALYCPECGFERHASGSSLRAGDICPDCRRGYLAEDR